VLRTSRIARSSAGSYFGHSSTSSDVAVSTPWDTFSSVKSQPFKPRNLNHAIGLYLCSSRIARSSAGSYFGHSSTSSDVAVSTPWDTLSYVKSQHFKPRNLNQVEKIRLLLKKVSRLASVGPVWEYDFNK
jgi:hypothetical protein